MSKFKHAIKENVTQVILIVFSVVLGLFLSGKIEARKERLESYELLDTIKSEVKDNIKLVSESALYHQDILEKLDSLYKNEEFIAEFVKDKSIIFEKLFTKGNIMGRFPANDAWDIAKSHPLIINIEHEKLLILSKIYNQQESTFKENIKKIFDLYSINDVNAEKNVRSNLILLYSYFHELVAREISLLEYYNEAYETLDLFIDLSAKELSKFSGDFWSEKESFARKIYVRDGTLRYYRNVNSEGVLMPVDSSEFKMINVASNFRVRFDNNGTRTMIVTLRGKETVLSEYQPKTYKIENLASFVGDYYNRDLSLSYSLKLEGGSLIFYDNESKKSSLNPILNNIFSGDDSETLRFASDQDGNILNFKLINGREKVLVFEKS